MPTNKEVDEMTPQEIDEEVKQIERDLAEKYGFEEEAVSKMVEIYPSLSLRDFFKHNNKIKECLVEVLQDRGRQPIPADASKFEVDKTQITKLVEVVDGKSVTREVVYKPVLIVKMLNSGESGKIFSRIPSGSEAAALVKIEYNRRRRGETLEGVFLSITQKTFVDATGAEREGYGVDEVTQLYLDNVMRDTLSLE